jgi:hypothetical protein
MEERHWLEHCQCEHGNLYVLYVICGKLCVLQINLFSLQLLSVQAIVPSELLNHYLSMIEPARAQTVDPEIMRQCAFSFPAVAFTLGRSNWTCIQDLYRTLARDMQVFQYSLQSTVFSIHFLWFGGLEN